VHALMIRIGDFFFTYRNRVFPLIVLALFALAVPTHAIFESEALERTKDLLALMIAFAGLSVRGFVIGFVYIKRGGLKKKIYADSLVTDGVFGMCRNPLYLGNLLIYLGVFLMHGNPIVITLGILVYVFIYQCIVFAEESYLEKKFGESYRAYCREVPRWGVKISHFKQATEGMTFNLGRALVKDYSTIAMTLIMLALTEGYEIVTEPHPLPSAVILIAAFILSVVAATGVFRLLKKRNWFTSVTSENTPSPASTKS
jgi:protein-S-isoprenylcysteine O-methyltransferase Ste14